MELDVEARDDGVAVVRCQGRLNMATATRLTEAIGHCVAGGSPRVLVDLTETPFVDSSGLGALISGLKRARQAGGDLRIAGVGAQVLAVLELTNLNRVLKPYPSLEEAGRAW
jgi:anti-sigma B factor antagonist